MYSLGNMHHHEGCIECVKRCSILNMLPPEQLEYIKQNRYEASFKAGEMVFKQGTPISHMISFSHGLAKTYIELKDGRNVVLGIIKSSSLVGSPGSYTDNRHDFSMSTLTDSLICFIDINAFKNVVRQNSDFAEAFIREISMRSQAMMRRYAVMVEKQMHGRMAELLLYVSDEVFRSQEFDIRLSRQDIADMTGMSKEGSIRIMKEFKDEGLIDFSGNVFKILNRQRLETISHSG